MVASDKDLYPWNKPSFLPVDGIIPLTVLQMGLCLFVSVFVTFISVLTMILNPNFKVVFYSAFTLGISSVILLIFAIFLMVSRWVELALESKDKESVGSVSYEQLKTIIKPNLALMSGAGLVLLVLSLGCYSYGLFLLIDNPAQMLIIFPGFILALVLIEFFS